MIMSGPCIPGCTQRETGRAGDAARQSLVRPFMCQVRLLEERLQQIRQVEEEVEDVKAEMRRLSAQAAGSAKLAEQQALHISELEHLGGSTGEGAAALCFCFW